MSNKKPYKKVKLQNSATTRRVEIPPFKGVVSATQKIGRDAKPGQFIPVDGQKTKNPGTKAIFKNGFSREG